jgi:molybdopterin molybdotransferase
MRASSLSYADALRAILDGASALDAETVSLHDAFGRALASPIVSDIALPPWDNSGMDGYAVRRADVASASDASPVTLHVIATAAAGVDPSTLPSLSAGSAVRIMTGAPVPPGTDAVIRVEDTDGGVAQVQIRSARDLSGRGNVRPRGEDVSVGETLFVRGTTLGASHIGVLASVGAARVSVVRRPRVTILSSGDELVPVEQFAEVRAGQRIVASSTYSLPPLLRDAGADVTVAPLVPDSLEAMMRAITDAVDGGCDLLVTTGGVSVGAHDYTRDALVALGGAVDFWRAKIRPGGPIGTGTVRGVRWLGLPGNPVSTMVTGTLFAWPLIRAMGGHATITHRVLSVTVRERMETAAPLTFFVRVQLERRADGGYDAVPAGPQGSNLMRTMAVADALLVVPEQCTAALPGDVFDAVLLP